jgi:hypothetical protein
VTQATLALAPTYHQGERISGQAVLRNTSGATCWYYSYSTQQGFKDGNGNPVAGLGSFIADAFTDTPFAPGQTLTLAPEWDQQVCTAAPACGPASPGTYSATVSWSFDGPPVEVTTTFQIVP